MKFFRVASTTNTSHRDRKAEPQHPVVEFIAHSPERGKRPSVVVASGCCCTCSCCSCFHSIGSVLGAMRADAKLTDVVVEVDGEESPVWTASNIYWRSVAVSGLLFATWAMLLTNLGMFALLLWMPAIQLCGSVVAFAAVSLFPISNKSGVLANIVLLTSGGIIGTVVGGAPLLLLFIL